LVRDAAARRGRTEGWDMGKGGVIKATFTNR